MVTIARKLAGDKLLEKTPEGPPGRVFCTNCGTSSSGGNFCTQCGLRLARGATPSAAPAQVQQPSAPAPAGNTELPCPACGRRNPRFAPECQGCGSSLTSGVAGPQATDFSSMGFSSPVALAGQEFMGFWIRAAASLIDLLITVAAIAILLLLFDSGGPALAYFLATGHNVVFVGLRGQTVGKMIFGMQVVNHQGNPPSFWRVLLREVVGKTISGLFLSLGYLWVGWNSEKRGWHDYIAGTYVVRKRRRPVASGY